jgi:hypothetical protein
MMLSCLPVHPALPFALLISHPVANKLLFSSSTLAFSIHDILLEDKTIELDAHEVQN